MRPFPALCSQSLAYHSPDNDSASRNKRKRHANDWRGAAATGCISSSTRHRYFYFRYYIEYHFLRFGCQRGSDSRRHGSSGNFVAAHFGPRLDSWCSSHSGSEACSSREARFPARTLDQTRPRAPGQIASNACWSSAVESREGVRTFVGCVSSSWQ